MTGLIFDIQGFSVHDGSGCRTLVFLSGCPLRCAWCANPEGQLKRPRLMFRASKCAHTHYPCIGACPHHAVHVDSESLLPILERAQCEHCASMDCVAACWHEALRAAGRAYMVDALMRGLSRDQEFWGSQGGVTFSGGEPLAQAEFLLAALAACRANYMHTAVETCAHIDRAVLFEVLKWTDWLFIDLKHLDSAAHQAATGVGNELILENIQAVAKWNGRVIVRVPIIPGFNDTVENLQASAEFVQRVGLREVNLLPFHRLGASKYEQLGLSYTYAQTPSPTPEAMQAHKRLFEAVGLDCYVGADTPF